MVRNIIIGLVVLIVAAVGGSFLMPQNVHVERSIVISASPDQVFAVVNDLTRAKEWGVWYKRDPNLQLTLEGPPEGVGAKIKWKSETEGEGSQEITESTPFSSVKSKLDFGGAGAAQAGFNLETVEGGTKVVWSFDTDVGMNPVMRYMGVMFDTWVGQDYEEGLKNLKQLVEQQAHAATTAALATPTAGAAVPPDVPMSASADPDKGPEIVTVDARPVLMTRSQAKASDAAALSTALGNANQKLLNFGMTHELSIAGAPLAITISHSAEGDWVFDAAMPLAELPSPAPAEADGVKFGQTYAGRAVKVTHKGPYNTLTEAYKRIHDYTKANNLKEKSVAWEEYVGDPGETEDAELLTNVYIAIE